MFSVKNLLDFMPSTLQCFIHSWPLESQMCDMHFGYICNIYKAPIREII